VRSSSAIGPTVTGAQRIAAAWAAHLGAVGVIAAADYATGPDIQFSAIYVVPILSAAARWGRPLAVATAVAAAASWYVNSDLVRPASTSPATVAWNSLSRLAIYLILALVVDQLRQKHAEVARLAGTDQLTGLANARRFGDELEASMARARRYGGELALLLIDCDDLKRVNDGHGHSDGNRVLSEVGQLIARSVRSTDLAARWGGDEFAVLQPEATLAGARIVAERIRQATHALRLQSSSGTPISVTVSIGIAVYPSMATTRDGLFEVADHALYEAKRGGKDRALTVAV
jgi:diguanylate cyclase (GGDEF)-like protein